MQAALISSGDKSHPTTHILIFCKFSLCISLTSGGCQFKGIVSSALLYLGLELRYLLATSLRMRQLLSANLF